MVGSDGGEGRKMIIKTRGLFLMFVCHLQKLLYENMYMHITNIALFRNKIENAVHLTPSDKV